jgi:uncharacterized protein YxjI
MLLDQFVPARAQMEITIQENSQSFRSEYEIETPGSYYFARKAFFSFPAKIKLQSSDERTLANIQRHFSFFRQRYDFMLSNGRVFHFWCEKRWKRVFDCKCDKVSYRLYGHKGLKYSIFQNDLQIAAFTKNRIVFGKGNQYEISLNEDADAIVIICMVLAINSSEDDDNNTTVTIDLGSIGPEEKSFDERWQPS